MSECIRTSGINAGNAGVSGIDQQVLSWRGVRFTRLVRLLETESSCANADSHPSESQHPSSGAQNDHYPMAKNRPMSARRIRYTGTWLSKREYHDRMDGSDAISAGNTVDSIILSLRACVADRIRLPYRILAHTRGDGHPFRYEVQCCSILSNIHF
jgi:hypothetical protein